MINKKFQKQFAHVAFMFSMLAHSMAAASISSFQEVDQMELKFKQQLSKQYLYAKKAFTNVRGVQNKNKGINFLALKSEDQYLELNRVNVMMGVFAAFDLAFVEFEITPYVDLRFEK